MSWHMALGICLFYSLSFSASWEQLSHASLPEILVRLPYTATNHSQKKVPWMHVNLFVLGKITVFTLLGLIIWFAEKEADVFLAVKKCKNFFTGATVQ
jgi:hypothetical protein